VTLTFNDTSSRATVLFKKLGRIQGGAGHRMTGRRHYNPRLLARRRQAPLHRRLQLRAQCALSPARTSA
jgi:hypothetical protein